MSFAKLFEHPTYGQLLAKLDVDDKGRPELRWFAQPPELGVCSIGRGFADSDKGWEDAETAFAGADAAAAAAAGKILFGSVGLAVPA